MPLPITMMKYFPLSLLLLAAPLQAKTCTYETLSADALEFRCDDGSQGVMKRESLGRSRFLSQKIESDLVQAREGEKRSPSTFSSSVSGADESLTPTTPTAPTEVIQEAQRGARPPGLFWGNPSKPN